MNSPASPLGPTASRDIVVGQFLGSEFDGIDPNLVDIKGLGELSIDSFFDQQPILVPELHIVTPKNNRVSLLDVRGMHQVFQSLHTEASRSLTAEKLLKRVLTSVVKIVDTPNANGLHHQHSTGSVPGTVYYPVSSSVQIPRQQVAHIASETKSVQRLAYLTSTLTEKHVEKLLGLI